MSPPSFRPYARTRVRLRTLVTHPVATTLVVAGVLHVLWWLLLANSGGDIAAQDAWAEFARAHPGSAYNLAWYGGMHPVSYSIVSPYVMALLGVRTTMIVAGTVSAALLALLLVRSKAVPRPLLPSLAGAVALLGNAVSGRVTFGLGMLFGLAALAVVFSWPSHWRTDELRRRLPRGALAAAFAGLATAGSPVAGLFLGIVAAGLWLGRRRAAAYALGVPPVAVVLISTWLFPFSGEQPIGWASVILPLLMGVLVLVLVPRGWTAVRLGTLVYLIAVLAAWLLPSPIGTNVTRMGLLFGGVLLVAAAVTGVRRSLRPLLALALVMSLCWQVGVAARDVLTTAPDAAWSADTGRVVRALQERHARLGRVEVVPTRSHREAAALAPYVNLARGWNRQADAERHPLFYDPEVPLTADSYRAWLDRWAVRFVVLAPGTPDAAAVEEAALVAAGLPYLREVWSHEEWRIYEVAEPTALVSAPAQLVKFDEAELVLFVVRPATIRTRIPTSPWLTLVDAEREPIPPPVSAAENVNGCLSVELDPGPPAQEWVVLHAPRAGLYRIAAPYGLRRGTTCPAE
ncbi:MAG TPA: MFS transporter [Nocardioides sp.]|uniref:MFS transporter n=1 Tax=Nocardioides sp. TaxID=35761 RepID=UPI002EDB8CC4